MTEHTPGPWSAEYVGADGSFEIWNVAKGDRAHKDSFAICSRNPIEHRAEVSRANARLIAVAPDLLAVAELARIALKNRDQTPGEANILAALKLVIAKATGG